MEEHKSLYKYAAEQGVPVGLLLTAQSLAVIYCDLQPWLAVAAIFMVAAMPVFTWRMLRSHYVSGQGFPNFSSLWMVGILAYMGGALIASLVSWAVLQYMRPDYMWMQAQNIISLYSADTSSQAQEIVAVVRGLISNNALPRPIELVMTGFWLASFAGSMLSAVVAVAVTLAPLRGKKS